MPPPNRNLWYFILLASLISFQANAEVFIWTDDQGQAHFSDTPPDNAPYRGMPTPDLKNTPLLLPEQRSRPSPRSATTRKTNTSVAPTTRNPRCQNYEQRLERVQLQLRNGYREPRGNRLRHERRELKSKLWNDC
ncbi:MAG: DUF4124 domain-containing protein [Halomonadaceae bacterium]|nr:MAG: DUF4124 domain-containing protein [Halomonadaceae bacterium]